MEDYLKKHRYHAGFGFSIDGTKEKHDLTRITRDGKGSYDKVIKSFYKYKQDYEDEIFQKSTFSSEDLVYLKDSIIHLWDLGFKNVEFGKKKIQVYLKINLKNLRITCLKVVDI